MVNPTTLQAQFAVSNAYAMLYHARIVSGAYKFDQKFYLTKEGEVPLTEEELLKSDLATMGRHIKRMSDITDALASLS